MSLYTYDLQFYLTPIKWFSDNKVSHSILSNLHHDHHQKKKKKKKTIQIKFATSTFVKFQELVFHVEIEKKVIFCLIFK